jgi:glycosyltransferase involved in cell wall biosynthesis
MCPLIVLEAQANCIPVLGADHTGISDLITEGKNGFLFRRNNIDDLRLKLERLINSNQLLEMNKTLNKSFVDEQSFLENHLIHYRKLIEER